MFRLKTVEGFMQSQRKGKVEGMGQSDIRKEGKWSDPIGNFKVGDWVLGRK